MTHLDNLLKPERPPIVRQTFRTISLSIEAFDILETFAREKKLPMSRVVSALILDNLKKG